MGEASHTPFLVHNRQQADLGETLRQLRQRPEHAQSQDHATLHVDRAGADKPFAVQLERPMVGVGDDRVEVAEQEQATAAAASDRRQQVGRMVWRRTRWTLDPSVRGNIAATRVQSCSAPSMSPEGEETATSDASSRSNPSQILSASFAGHPALNIAGCCHAMACGRARGTMQAVNIRGRTRFDVELFASVLRAEDLGLAS